MIRLVKEDNSEVLVRKFRGKTEWLDGTVTEQTGPVSHKVPVGE